MSIFSKFKDFKSNRQDAKADRALRTIKNAKASKEDRWAALEYFKSLDDVALAVPALLARFDYSLEHGINDTREKELAMEGISRHGVAAIAIIREHLITTTRIAWPLKILKSIGTEKDLVETLKASLNFGEVSFDENATDKNYDILCYLIEYKVDGFAAKLEHFVNDPDERVRYAATEVLVEQADPEVPGILEKFLNDTSPENTRIRQTVLNAFWTKKWTLKNPSVFPNGHIVDGLYTSPQGVLQLRNGQPQA